MTRGKKYTAERMDSASATLESPLDSSKHIITQLLCPAQRSLMQRFQLSPSLPINPGSERERRITTVSFPPLPVIRRDNQRSGQHLPVLIGPR
jgi:hypothetical protein